MPVRRFIDLLNWGGLVAPGVMVCKDGTLIAGWRVSGMDTESMEPEAIAGRIRHLTFALSGLSGDQALWVVYDRHPWRPNPEDAPQNTGQDALDLLAMEAHFLLADGGSTWADRLTIFLAYRPDETAGLDGDIAAFETLCGAVESRFKSALVLHRLKPAAIGDPCPFCAALMSLISPGRRGPRFGPDDLPVGLDQLLGADVRQPQFLDRIQVDGRPLAILSLEGLPTEYDILPMERFQSLPVSFTWVTQYRALSRQNARRLVRKQQRYWTQAAADFVANIGGEQEGKRDRYGDQMAFSLESVFARLSQGDEGHGLFCSQFLVHGIRADGDDGVGDAVAALQSAADDANFTLRQETHNAIPALFSALPGHMDINQRRVLMRAQGMADFMPVRSIWHGSRTCPSALLPAGTPALLPARAETGELFYLNLHHKDVGHTLIFGPTGAGKSVLLGQLVSGWLRYPNAQVIYFDRQRSIAHACAAFGGTFLEPGVAGQSGIAPLAHLDRLGTDWGLDWLTALVEMGLDRKPTPDQAAELRHALTNLADAAGLPGVLPASLQRVWEFVQDKELRQVLQAWREGPRAGIFDDDRAGVAQALAASRLTVFETHPMFEANWSSPTEVVLRYV